MERINNKYNIKWFFSNLLCYLPMISGCNIIINCKFEHWGSTLNIIYSIYEVLLYYQYQNLLNLFIAVSLIYNHCLSCRLTLVALLCMELCTFKPAQSSLGELSHVQCLGEDLNAEVQGILLAGFVLLFKHWHSSIPVIPNAGCLPPTCWLWLSADQLTWQILGQT